MPSRLPDILWILTTQWRAQACGYAGDPNARTPNLDRLAAEGVNYAQAVTPHPFGPFARAALLTGVGSPLNGVRDYYDPLPREARTIAHALRDRGYATAFFGKWHLYRRDPAAPLVGEAHARTVVPPGWRGGFEFWEGFEGGFLLNGPWLHGTRFAAPERFEGYQSDVLCARAGEWLRGQRAQISNFKSQISKLNVPISTPNASSPTPHPRQPWFCVVSMEAPHPPYDAPVPGVAPRDWRELKLPPNVPRGGTVEMKARKELAGYHAHIEATDRAIGRLLAAVNSDWNALPPGRSAGAGGGAVCPPRVVFTSVHGDMHGAHGLFRKGWPYEESVRVPLLIGGGRRGAGGRRSEAAVSLVDLPRMTLDWADGRKPGREREVAHLSMPSVVKLPHQCDCVWRGVRTKTRKLVLDQAGLPWLFFDLERDPWERKNLAGDPARAREIAEFVRLANRDGFQTGLSF